MLKKLINQIKNKKINVCIIGLGYVGLKDLPFRFLNAKINVIGIENISKINKIKSGISYIENKNFKNNKYYEEFQKKVSNDYTKISDVDVIILCLPTPGSKIILLI